MGAEWVVAQAAPTEFLKSSRLYPLIGQVFYNRGLRSVSEIDAYLRGEDAAASSFSLADMTPAVDRILRAIRWGEGICVYGGFDVDGVASTALLVRALLAAGANIGHYIPDYVDEGYGLNLNTVKRIAGRVKLLITVGCGTRSLDEVLHARHLGLDVCQVPPDNVPGIARVRN